MAQFTADADLHVVVTMHMSEAEARALRNLADWDVTKSCGDEQHRKALQSFLGTAKAQLPGLLERAERARKAFGETPASAGVVTPGMVACGGFSPFVDPGR